MKYLIFALCSIYDSAGQIKTVNIVKGNQTYIKASTDEQTILKVGGGGNG